MGLIKQEVRLRPPGNCNPWGADALLSYEPILPAWWWRNTKCLVLEELWQWWAELEALEGELLVTLGLCKVLPSSHPEPWHPLNKCASQFNSWGCCWGSRAAVLPWGVRAFVCSPCKVVLCFAQHPQGLCPPGFWVHHSCKGWAGPFPEHLLARGSSPDKWVL